MSPSRGRKTDLRGADADVLKIVAVQSGDPRRIRRVLDSGEPLPPSLVPHLIALLGDDRVARDAMRGLRTIASERPGALIDALLDVRQSRVIRRRLARVMSDCRTPDVVEALLQAGDDDHISVRIQCARTLFLVRRRHPELAVDGERVMAAIRKEISRGAQDIGLVFTLLALVFPSGPIRVAYRSLRGSSAPARGFAMEYLNGVVPPDLRDKMAAIVGRLSPKR